jgi:8-oxo-dGTP pyrophosphatase MutT (NUDIX family)
VKDGVAGIILTQANSHVLLIKRRDIPIWVLPGGGIETGEDPAETVVREIYEESGFVVKILRKCGEYYPINRLASFTHVYVCQIVDGDIHQGEESLEVGFFPLQQLPSPCLQPHLDWIQEALENHAETLKKPITQITYTKLFQFFLSHPMLVIRAICARIGLPINS